MSRDNQPVNNVVGDRIMLTLLISLGTILFTWAIAIPTGIYSAVRQYSPGDYALTLFGFLGMCIPSFLLAIILMYLAKVWFGADVGGLFSNDYATQAEWDAGKVWDLTKHIWLPIVVLGVTGTGAMIRIMRGNLLDELKEALRDHRPRQGCATTEAAHEVPRATGLEPVHLRHRPPVPDAGLGRRDHRHGAVAADRRPLQLNAILEEDTYLAGSMLMVLSLLGVIGTLVSDLLLLWLDPRIRMESGGK